MPAGGGRRWTIGFEDLFDAGADLGAGEIRVVAVEADDLGDLPAPLRLRAGRGRSC
jgi:hypothetical protein